MEYLTSEELEIINQYLDQQGLTFKPLREEMLDHMLGDLNNKISNGASFEEAWNNIISEIPENHFESLQSEIMETINKKFNISKGLSYLSLVLILTMVLFKMMHLSMSGILLLITFATIGASLFFGSIHGLYPFKHKKESLLLMGAVVGIEVFLLSFGFQVLHLPGFSILRFTSVMLLLIFYPGITWYLFKKGDNKDHILTYLHNKHSPGIERYLMVLLVMALALRFISMGFGVTPDVSHVLLFLVMAGAGLQFFALNWHHQETQDRWLQAAIIIAFAGFILPSLSWMSRPMMSINLATLFTALFFMMSAGIIYIKFHKLTNHIILGIFIAFIGVLYLGWLLVLMGVLSEGFYPYLFNIPILLLLTAFLLYFMRHSMIKMFMLIVIAHYLFEYPIRLGLW